MSKNLMSLAVAAIAESGNKSPRLAALLLKLGACSCDDDPADNDAILSFQAQNPALFSQPTTTLTLIPGVSVPITVPVGGQRVQIMASMTVENATGTPANLQYQIFIDGAPINTVGYAILFPLSGQNIGSGATAANVFLLAGGHTIELRVASTVLGNPVTFNPSDARINVIQLPAT